MIASRALKGAPNFLIAIIEALHFEHPSTEHLRALTGDEWTNLLGWCDRRQLTLMLPSLLVEALPSNAQSRIQHCQLRYAERFGRLKSQLFEITEALEKANIRCIVLKGFTHSPSFTPDPLLRGQGDIDIWVRSVEIGAAQRILTGLGYISSGPSGSRHLPSMFLPNHWKWQGDLFDPEMPIAVELHYELWSEHADRISVPGTNDFWDRSVFRTFDGRCLRVLCERDLLGFAALHLIAHLLHGDLPIQRAWEIANFLHQRAEDDSFWMAWQGTHPADLRKLEVVVFQLMHLWFGCHLSQIVQSESDALPARVRAWLNTFSFSPLVRQFRPNKDELWLYLALTSPLNRIRIVLRRLLPLHLPGFVDDFDDHSRLRVVRRVLRQRGLIASRAAHHLRTFLPAIFQGARWFYIRKG